MRKHMKWKYGGVMGDEGLIIKNKVTIKSSTYIGRLPFFLSLVSSLPPFKNLTVLHFFY